jgi:hypothetical protein
LRFVFRTFSALFKIFLCYQGRRVPLRFTLAPGYYISRLWRWPFALPFIFRAFGAGRLPLAIIFRAFGGGRLTWLSFSRLSRFIAAFCAKPVSRFKV